MGLSREASKAYKIIVPVFVAAFWGGVWITPMRRREFIMLRYRTTPVNIIHENENAEYR